MQGEDRFALHVVSAIMPMHLNADIGCQLQCQETYVAVTPLQYAELFATDEVTQ